MTWTKHARVLDSATIPWAKRAVWAPSIVVRDGWYTCSSAPTTSRTTNRSAASASRNHGSRTGRSKTLIGRPLVDKFHNGAQPIDPFVFKDEDGTFYLLYDGWRHCNIAKLNADFSGFVPFADGTTFKEITPAGYVEGSFMFVKDGKYYFMWSEGGWRPTTPWPMPSVHRRSGCSNGWGRSCSRIRRSPPARAIIRFCAPLSGRWYIVYHRRPLGETDRNHRVVCIDELKFDERGQILPVVITKEGVLADRATR